MSRLLLVVLVALAALTAVAQPGLCPCWLIANVDEVHPHAPGQAAHPHNHDYLFDLFNAQPPVAPIVLAPLAALILLMALSGQWLRLRQQACTGHPWVPIVEAPPPRNPFASAVLS